MSTEAKLILFQTLTSVFLILWLWSAYILTKTSRAASRATGLLEFMRQQNAFADLSEKLLQQNKSNCEVQCEVVKGLQTLADRMSAYNENLNHLTSAVRTKVERIDKNSVKM